MHALDELPASAVRDRALLQQALRKVVDDKYDDAIHQAEAALAQISREGDVSLLHSRMSKITRAQGLTINARSATREDATSLPPLSRQTTGHKLSVVDQEDNRLSIVPEAMPVFPVSRLRDKDTAKRSLAVLKEVFTAPADNLDSLRRGTLSSDLKVLKTPVKRDFELSIPRSEVSTFSWESSRDLSGQSYDSETISRGKKVYARSVEWANHQFSQLGVSVPDPTHGLARRFATPAAGEWLQLRATKEADTVARGAKSDLTA
jgi:hypothetical protein